MRRKSFKAICLFLVVLMISGTSALLVGCSEYKKPISGSKAIIIVPGILGSGLGVDVDGEFVPKWDPLGDQMPAIMESLGNGDIMELLKNETIMGLVSDLKTPNSLLKVMAMNDDGSSVNPDIRPSDFFKEGDQIKYGAIDFYKEMYLSLESKYSDTHEVFVFNYDWRGSTFDAAKLLDHVVRTNRYENVILLSHSMGGLVSSQYAALSEENAEKIEMHVSYGTPYYGASKGFSAIVDPYFFMGLETDAIPSIIGNIEQDLKNLLKNMKGIHELFPSREMFEMPEMNALEEVFNINGVSVKTYDQYIAAIVDMQFNKGADGQAKQLIQAAQEVTDKVYVDVDGVRTHIAHTINTKFIIGLDEGATDLSYNIVDNKVSESMFVKGDNTVPYYSATCGLPLDADNVFAFENVGHGELTIEFDMYTKDLTFRLIDELYVTIS